MPQISLLGELYDKEDKRYTKALEQIINNDLKPAERRLVLNRLCTKTHNPLPVDNAPAHHLDPEVVKAVVNRIISLLDERGVPRRQLQTQ